MRLLELAGGLFKRKKTEVPQPGAGIQPESGVINRDAQEGANRQQLVTGVARDVTAAINKKYTPEDAEPSNLQRLLVDKTQRNPQGLGQFNYDIPEKSANVVVKDDKPALEKLGLGAVYDLKKMAQHELDHAQGKENIGYHFEKGKEFLKTATGRVKAIVDDSRKN